VTDCRDSAVQVMADKSPMRLQRSNEAWQVKYLLGT
jgi:hypothetical protein